MDLEIGTQKAHDHPSLGLLRHVLEWVQKHKLQLFNQPPLTPSSQSHGAIDDNKNTPFSGLLFWTLSHPLGKISDEICSEERRKEDQAISELHFELIDVWIFKFMKINEKIIIFYVVHRWIG